MEKQLENCKVFKLLAERNILELEKELRRGKDKMKEEVKEGRKRHGEGADNIPGGPKKG